MAKLTDTVKHLLIINVLFFIAAQLYQNEMYGLFSLWFPEHPNFQLWQIISHMFMHGSITHIVFNMYGLYAFGTPLEQMWGRNKFLFFYFSAGLGSALLHIVVNYYVFNESLQALVANGIPETQILEIIAEGKYSPSWNDIIGVDKVNSFLEVYNTPAVGASGAIYGILVAFAFMYSEAELMLIFLPVPIKAKYFVPLILVGDLFFGFTGAATGIAHFAHIGGAIAGFIMMLYWKKNQFNNNRWN